jgi:hypothetical protein
VRDGAHRRDVFDGLAVDLASRVRRALRFAEAVRTPFQLVTVDAFAAMSSQSAISDSCASRFSPSGAGAASCGCSDSQIAA